MIDDIDMHSLRAQARGMVETLRATDSVEDLLQGTMRLSQMRAVAKTLLEVADTCYDTLLRIEKRLDAAHTTGSMTSALDDARVMLSAQLERYVGTNAYVRRERNVTMKTRAVFSSPGHYRGTVVVGTGGTLEFRPDPPAAWNKPPVSMTRGPLPVPTLDEEPKPKHKPTSLDGGAA